MQKRPVQEGSKTKDESNFKMETSGLKCGAADCDFSTPDFGPEFYPTMVAHLQVLRVFRNLPYVTAPNQVHAATKHNVNTSTAVPPFSSTATLSSADVMNASTVPAQDLARSRSASRSRILQNLFHWIIHIIRLVYEGGRGQGGEETNTWLSHVLIVESAPLPQRLGCIPIGLNCKL